jgi:hypothetical protein
VYSISTVVADVLHGASAKKYHYPITEAQSVRVRCVHRMVVMGGDELYFIARRAIRRLSHSIDLCDLDMSRLDNVLPLFSAWYHKYKINPIFLVVLVRYY